MNHIQYKAYWPKTSSYRFREEKVKELLRELRLSAYDLADKLGTSQPTIHRTLTNQTFNEKLQKVIVSFLVRTAKRNGVVTSESDLLTERERVQKQESSAPQHAA